MWSLAGSGLGALCHCLTQGSSSAKPASTGVARAGSLGVWRFWNATRVSARCRWSQPAQPMAGLVSPERSRPG